MVLFYAVSTKVRNVFVAEMDIKVVFSQAKEWLWPFNLANTEHRHHFDGVLCIFLNYQC